MGVRHDAEPPCRPRDHRKPSTFRLSQGCVAGYRRTTTLRDSRDANPVRNDLELRRQDRYVGGLEPRRGLYADYTSIRSLKWAQDSGLDQILIARHGQQAGQDHCVRLPVADEHDHGIQRFPIFIGRFKIWHNNDTLLNGHGCNGTHRTDPAIASRPTIWQAIGRGDISAMPGLGPDFTCQPRARWRSRFQLPASKGRAGRILLVRVAAHAAIPPGCLRTPVSVPQNEAGPHLGSR